MSEAAPIRFHLDFVSTYSYFASQGIDAVAAHHGRRVDWIVVSLPHVFRAAGTTSPLEQPLKLAHNRQDTQRCAAMLGLPFAPPATRPNLRLARLLFHRLKAREADAAARFARSAMALRFGTGREIDSAEALAGVAADLGIDRADVDAAACDPVASRALREATDAAVADGMFGAPFARIGDARFWGHDRVLDHLDWWLAREKETTT